MPPAASASASNKEPEIISSMSQPPDTNPRADACSEKRTKQNSSQTFLLRAISHCLTRSKSERKNPFAPRIQFRRLSSRPARRRNGSTVSAASSRRQSPATSTQSPEQCRTSQSPAVARRYSDPAPNRISRHSMEWDSPPDRFREQREQRQESPALRSIQLAEALPARTSTCDSAPA